MAHDKNTSPAGWYLGSYLIRPMELADPDRNDPVRRFWSWENTVVVRARSFDEAFGKVVLIGKRNCGYFRGGAHGRAMKWQFLGVTELLPIYEDLKDGAEIAWTDHAPKTLRALRARTKNVSQLKQ